MCPVRFYSTKFLNDRPLSYIRLGHHGHGKTEELIRWRHGYHPPVMESPRQCDWKECPLPSKDVVDFLNRLLPSNTAVTTWLPLLKHDVWQPYNTPLLTEPRFGAAVYFPVFTNTMKGNFWSRNSFPFSGDRATIVTSQLITAFACHHPRPFFELFKNPMMVQYTCWGFVYSCSMLILILIAVIHIFSFFSTQVERLLQSLHRNQTRKEQNQDIPEIIEEKKLHAHPRLSWKNFLIPVQLTKDTQGLSDNWPYW